MKVYRLIAIEIEDGRKPSGVYAATETALGVFTSVDKAEAMIRIHAEKVKAYRRVLGYALYENELDDLTLHGPWKGIPEFLSVRTYFANGTLNAFCDCDDTCGKHWHGRDLKTVHYRRGDFVSVWQGRKVVPMLIGELPISTKRKITGDWTDDCYLAFCNGLGHDHPFTPYVFPLVGELSDREKNWLLAERDEDAKLYAPAPRTARIRTNGAAQDRKEKGGA